MHFTFENSLRQYLRCGRPKVLGKRRQDDQAPLPFLLRFIFNKFNKINIFMKTYKLFLNCMKQLNKSTFCETVALRTWGWSPTHLCLMTWKKSLLFNCKYRSVITSERHSTTSRQRVFITPWNFGSRKNTVFINLTRGHGQWVRGQS